MKKTTTRARILNDRIATAMESLRNVHSDVAQRAIKTAIREMRAELRAMDTRSWLDGRSV